MARYSLNSQSPLVTSDLRPSAGPGRGILTMSFRTLICLLLLALVITSPAHAVREDLILDLQVKSVDASHFPIVQVNFLVSDRDGAYLRNLQERHFAVAENRFPLESFIVESSLKNMDVVLCLDSSASMKKSMKDLKRAAYTFVRGLDPLDRCAVVSFENRVTTLQDFTNDKYLISNAVFQMRPAGGTMLYDGLFESINKCMLAEGKKAIVLITDGEDESYSGQTPFSRHTLEEVIVHARQVGVSIYVIGIGNDVDRHVLASLANETDGTYYFLPSPYELNRMIKLILNGFKTYYKMTFASPCPRKDGTARAVEVECTVQDRSGHAQVLYMAPGGSMDNWVPIKKKKYESGLGNEPTDRAKFRHLRRRHY